MGCIDLFKSASVLLTEEPGGERPKFVSVAMTDAGGAKGLIEILAHLTSASNLLISLRRGKLLALLKTAWRQI